MLRKKVFYPLLFGSLFMVCALVTVRTSAQPQVSKVPLSKEDVLRLVRNQLGDEAGARSIEQRGIDFTPTDDFLQALQTAGASEVFLAALRSAHRPQPLSATAGKALDGLQVVLLVLDGVSVQRVADLVRQRGLIYAPDAQQLEFIGELGVPEIVLTAMKQAPIYPETGSPSEIRLKHIRLAEEDFRERLRKTSHSIPLREGLALILKAEGKNPEADSLFHQVDQDLRSQLARTPENASLREQLSILREMDGENQIAMATNGISAEESLRTLNLAAANYASKHGGEFPASLSTLGPPTGQASVDDGAGLIDSRLASGTKDGYVFSYRSGPRDANGRITTYVIYADPIRLGGATGFHYFTDQSRVTRREFDKPANERSPPIPQ